MASLVQKATRRGYAMVVALLVITLLIAGGALLAQELLMRSMLLGEETGELHLQNILDSAVSHTMAKYRNQPDFEGADTLEIDGGEARIFAEVVSVYHRRVSIEALYRGEKRKAVVQLYVATGEPIRLTDWDPVSSSLPYR
jgi:hypothetical protein